MPKGPMSQDQKDKISATLKARKIQPSAKARQAASTARTAQGNSPEHRKKISKALSGIVKSPEQIESNRQAQLKWNADRRARGEQHHNVDLHTGNKMSEETKAKLSKMTKSAIAEGRFEPYSFKDVKRSDKNIHQLSLSRLGKLNPQWHPANVYDAKTDELIASNICISEFSRDMGYSEHDRSMFYMSANGYSVCHRGLRFEYVEE